MSEINKRAENFWRYGSYNHKGVKELFEQFGHTSNFVYLHVSEDNKFLATPSAKVGSGEGAHLPTVLSFFREVFSGWQGEVPPVGYGFVVWLDDGLFWYRQNASMKVPLLTFARERSDSCSFLIPDPAFMRGRGYEEEIAEIEQNEIEWDKKDPVLFWRGAGSGREIQTESWKSWPRVRICTIEHENIDCRISRIPYPEGSPDYEKLKPYLGPLVPFKEFISKKYQFDADGFSCAWISCFLKLHINSVLFKVYQRNEQWYYDELIPWTNYIPLGEGLVEVKEKVEWALAHDNECREISRAAKQMISKYTYERALQDVRKTLDNVFRFYEPEVG